MDDGKVTSEVFQRTTGYNIVKLKLFRTNFSYEIEEDGLR